MPYRRPYGNDFLVETPQLDKLGDRIYAEQRQRELYQQQQNKMLDDEFARNMSGIRDADIGDLTKAYGDYKLAYKNLLKKRQGGTPEEQLEVLRKKAGVYDVINKSKEDKTWEDAQAKQIMTDRKGYYADDAHQQLLQRRQTPISKLDRTKDENLLYQYSVPDLAKEIKTAKGEEHEVPILLGESKTDKLKDDKEIYKVGNSPDMFANRLLEGILTSNKGRNFSGVMNHKYSDEEVEDLKNRYAAKISNPKFVAVYGEPKPLPATDTDLGKAVAIRTMEEYADMDLKPTKVTSEVNQERKTKDTQAFQLKKQAIGHKNSLENIIVAAKYRGNDPATINRNVDEIIATHIANAQSLDGEVPMSALTFKMLTGDELGRRSVVKVDNEGNYEYGRREDDGTITRIKTIPLVEAKAALTKGYKAGLSGSYNTGDKKPEVTKPTNIPSYKKSDLLKAGWTEEQINKATKANKIKIQ